MIIRPEQHSVSPLRLLRGTKLADIPNDPPPRLADIDSAFHIAEYLALLVRHDPHDVHALVALPEGSKGGENDKNLWIYEHLRRIPVDLTVLVTSLLGTCTAETCPQMKADEWQYLCTAHGNEGAEECSAIDYILHTLDSTTALLTFPEVFPSRITISQSSTAHFQPLFRRLSRIFSHAYYSHRELFQLAEVETSLYARFVALCEKYDLVTSNLLVIPRQVVADSLDGVVPEPEDEDEDEEEVEDEEEEEEDRSRSREKGEGGRRPHSLDRHARPHKLDDLRGTVKGWSQEGEKAEAEVPVPESTSNTDKPAHSTATTTSSQPDKTENESSTESKDAERDEQEKPKSPMAAPAESNIPTTQSAPTPTEVSPTHQNPDPISLSTSQTYSLKPRTKKPKDDNNKPKIQLPPHGTGTGTLGKSTLGKKSRGTMLWTSDSPSTSEKEAAVSTPTIEEPEPVGLERTESIETAILAPEDLEGEGPVPPEQIAPIPDEVESEVNVDEEEEVVPKDEIELLEEEGVLEPLPTTSPVTGTVPTPESSAGTPTTDAPISTSTDAPTSTSTDEAPAKVEKVEEIEKGIENLEEIKDVDQVIPPADVDLLDSTPHLDSDSTDKSEEIKTDSTSKSDLNTNTDNAAEVKDHTTPSIQEETSNSTSGTEKLESESKPEKSESTSRSETGTGTKEKVESTTK